MVGLILEFFRPQIKEELKDYDALHVRRGDKVKVLRPNLEHSDHVRPLGH